MSTKVYGVSDDLVEVEGELVGEVNVIDEDALLCFDDGTVLIVHYGKPGLGGVWAITVFRAGDLFDHLDICNDEEADPYSDVAHFKDGRIRAWAGERAEKVQ